jgi:hypothetical protein
MSTLSLQIVLEGNLEAETLLHTACTKDKGLVQVWVWGH